MIRQRRLLLASLLSVCAGLALACAGGVKNPAPEKQEAEKTAPVDPASTAEVDRLRKAMEDAEAEAELLMGRAGLTDAEKRYVRWSVGSGMVRKFETGKKPPILDIDKPIRDGDVGIPHRRAGGGDMTNILAIDRIVGPDEVVLAGGTAWVKGVPTEGLTVDSTITLTGTFAAEGSKDFTTRLNKKVVAPYLVAVDIRKLGPVLASDEVARWLAAKTAHDAAKAEAIRVATAARDSKEADAPRKKAEADRDSRAARAEREARRERLAKTKGLEWIESDTKFKSGSGGFVSGTVRNTNKHKVTGVKITFDLFKGGARTGTATDKIPSLDAGQKWSFKAPSKRKEFDAYELAELSGN